MPSIRFWIAQQNWSHTSLKIFLERPLFALPVYSGKQIINEDFLIFSSKMSFLLRKRMMDVPVNHLLLQMLSNSFSDSCMRFCNTKETERQAKMRQPHGHCQKVEKYLNEYTGKNKKGRWQQWNNNIHVYLYWKTWTYRDAIPKDLRYCKGIDLCRAMQFAKHFKT